MIGGEPKPVAFTEGRFPDWVVVSVVVGFHVTVWVSRATVKVTSFVPSSAVDVAAAVARTTQLPEPVKVRAPVVASTEQVVVLLLTTE